MKISLVQSFLHWENCGKNLVHLTEHLNNCANGQDLIILPEMFSTGFTMKPETMAEKEGGAALTWLKEKAIQKNSIITGSVSVEDEGKYYNRLYWSNPEGQTSHYNKRHLFRMAGEDKHYTPGNKKLICQIKNWRVMPLVCYDLRFPVWSRNKFEEKNNLWEYDVLIYVANWPAVRSYAWRQLLIARAIENQCYVIGVNRVGRDGNDFDHTGNSMVIDYKGNVLSELADGAEGILNAELDYDGLMAFRKNFPAGMDADRFDLL